MPLTTGELLGLNLSGHTVRRYHYQWLHNDSHFLRDRRGKMTRELIVNEEDIGNKLRKWARKNADKPQFIDKATEYVNGTLLTALPAGMLTEYKTTVPVARSTVARWLTAAEIRRGWATQNYYNDNHQAPLVIKQREEYIPVRRELELRQPLWIQLTESQHLAMQCKATRLHKEKQREIAERKRARKPKFDRKGREIVPDESPLVLPTPHYVYQVRVGRDQSQAGQEGEGSGVAGEAAGKEITMYEYHVDDAEAFLDWRMLQRLGGNFSRKPELCMPAEEDMSAPDVNLLEAGVTLADVDGSRATAGSAAEANGASGADGAGGAGGAAASGSADDAAHVADDSPVGSVPTTRSKWTEAAAKTKKMDDLRTELERVGLTPLADGSGSGPRGKVQKADLLRQLAPLCQQPARERAPAAADAPARTPADSGEEDEDEDAEWKLDRIIGRRVTLAGELDPDGNPYPVGITLWHVQWEPIDGQPAERTWEPEWNVEGAQPAVHEFMGRQAAPAWCKHKHHPDVCKCRRPLWHLGQDEKIWKAFQMQKATWLVKSVRALRKKTDGPGKMASGCQDELRGFGLRMSASELRKVNRWRAERKRPPLESSPGLQFMKYGKNNEGYWDAEMFGKQIDKILDVFDCLHPDWQLCLEVRRMLRHLHAQEFHNMP